jgi:hypothetical protein
MLCGKFLDIRDKYPEKLVITYRTGMIARKIPSIMLIASDRAYATAKPVC